MEASRAFIPSLRGGSSLARRRIASAVVLAPALAAVAEAQIASTDIVLNIYNGGQRIERLRTDGSSVWTSTGGTGTLWEGCSLTPQGHVVTTRRNPSAGINVFDQNGAYLHDFPTPQVTFVPGDVSVFSDGTLAVADQGGKVHLYTEAGAFVSTLTPAGLLHPFGSYVDNHDQLFLCDINAPFPSLGQILKLSRSGQLLATFPLPFSPGDMVAALDGTLWVSDRSGLKVRHLDALGGQLGEFPVTVVGLFSGIALHFDGTILATGENSAQIFRYDTAGGLLGTIQIPSPTGTPLFLATASCALDPVTYCAAKLNSVGCLPAISAVGTPSSTAVFGFTVSAALVRNQKAGLLLHGVTGRNNLPFQGGLLCVMTPVRRSTGVNSGGTPLPASDCTGVFAIDMNAFAHGLLGGNPLPALSTPGTLVDCQWWGRDPGFPFPNNTTLSNGLEYLICN